MIRYYELRAVPKGAGAPWVKSLTAVLYAQASHRAVLENLATE